MAVQFDLPDFGTTRQVTDDPIININQAVNVTPYDSGTKDVGQFTRLHVAAVANGGTGIWQLKIRFHPTSDAATNAFEDVVYLKGQGVWYNTDYPTMTRYVQFLVSEITNTGQAVILQVSPSSGPSTPFTLAQPSLPPFSSTVGSLATATYDPQLIFRGVWRINAVSRTPSWTLTVKARDSAVADSTVLSISNKTASLPLDIAVRLETASLYVTFLNGWVNAIGLYLFMSVVGL